MAAEPRLQLPQEIWLMVCQELTQQNDFNGLFTCALVSQGLAGVALPLLYSVQENSPASTGEASQSDKQKWARLWRSIILSSIGATAHPYCLWIKSLKLGNLESLLEDVASQSASTQQLKALFFEEPMQQFNITRETAVPTRTKGPLLDLQAIVNKVGDTITDFVKEAAERENKTVTVDSLEGWYISTTLLPKWTSKLSLLTSLTIRDGSVLGAEAAAAIRKNCPCFKDLACHFCRGGSVDEDLADFLEGIPENTLEGFALISFNDIGEKALHALDRHSASLRRLKLASLGARAIQNLHLLSSCTHIEELELEAQPIGPPLSWETEYKDAFLEVISWLGGCASLRSLTVFNMPNATSLLAEVLKSGSVQLHDLDLKLNDENEAFYSVFGQQTSLQSLRIQSDVDELLDVPGPRHEAFVSSICALRELRSLNLNMILTWTDLSDIATNLILLEDFTFDGESMDDTIWPLFGQLPQLKSLTINASATFSFEGILGFVNLLEEAGEGHRGFRLDIAAQMGEFKFSPDEEALLRSSFEPSSGGRVEFSYFRDPDEEHEDDFSD